MEWPLKIITACMGIFIICTIVFIVKMLMSKQRDELLSSIAKTIGMSILAIAVAFIFIGAAHSMIILTILSVIPMVTVFVFMARQW